MTHELPSRGVLGESAERAEHARGAATTRQAGPADRSEPIRFGLIGVSSAHSLQFTRLFGDGRTGTVRGGTISCAWKAPTIAGFPPSEERNDALASELSGLGVPLLASPDDVAEASDALLLIESDVRTHSSLFRRAAKHGKPIYVDTRFARSRVEAEESLVVARENGCLVLAGSPKRFTPEFRAAADGTRVKRLDLTGPLPTQPGHPGLAWYGVHLVDLAVAALGPGCTSVDFTDGRYVLTWDDGRIATLGGEPTWSPDTEGVVGTAQGERRFHITSEQGMLTGLLESIVDACTTGIPNVAEPEVVETVAIVEAAGRLHAAR